MPARIDTATAAPESKLNQNGATRSSTAAAYSMKPCTKRGMGPSRIISPTYTRKVRAQTSAIRPGS